MKGGSTVVH